MILGHGQDISVCSYGVDPGHWGTGDIYHLGDPVTQAMLANTEMQQSSGPPVLHTQHHRNSIVLSPCGHLNSEQCECLVINWKENRALEQKFVVCAALETSCLQLCYLRILPLLMLGFIYMHCCTLIIIIIMIIIMQMRPCGLNFVQRQNGCCPALPKLLLECNILLQYVLENMRSGLELPDDHVSIPPEGASSKLMYIF